MPTTFDLLRDGFPCVVGTRLLCGRARLFEIRDQFLIGNPPHPTHELTSTAVDPARPEPMRTASTQARNPKRLNGGFPAASLPDRHRGPYRPNRSRSYGGRQMPNSRWFRLAAMVTTVRGRMASGPIGIATILNEE